MKRLLVLLALFAISLSGSHLFAQDAITPDVNFYNDDLLRNYSKAADFFDNPKDYVGKTIQIILLPQISGTLRSFVGANVPFRAYTDAPSGINLYIKIPEGMKVPNAGTMDRLMIVFRCDKGSLSTGNVVLSITRY